MLTRKRTLIVAGLLLSYLALGFLALPALLKWQLEKQVFENLAHRISIASIHFNPLTFRLEANDIALENPEGEAMLGVRGLTVDFELRSLIDRAWNFSELALDAPRLRFALGEQQGHNFSALLERLGGEEQAAEESGPPPRLIVQRLALTEGRIEFEDARLEEPLITRIEPLLIEVSGLSTVPDRLASYRLEAPANDGERLNAEGELALVPFAVRGDLSLSEFKLATLARALSRQARLEGLQGVLEIGARLDLGLADDGRMAGKVDQIGLDIDGFSLALDGAAAPVAAIGKLSLEKAQVDLTSRKVTADALRLAQGTVAAQVDKDGRVDWAGLATAQSDAPAAETPTEAAAPEDGSDAPWQVSIGKAQISELALNFADAREGSSAHVDALDIGFQLDAMLGGMSDELVLTAPKLSMAGTRLGRGADQLGLPAAAIGAARIALTKGVDGLELALLEPGASAPDGLTARLGERSIELHGLELEAGKAALGSTDTRLTLSVGTPRLRLSGIASESPNDRAGLDEFKLSAAQVALNSGGGPLDLQVSELAGALGGLRLGRQDQAAELASARIDAQRVTLSQATADAPLSLEIGGTAVELGQLALSLAEGASKTATIGKVDLGGDSLRLAIGDMPLGLTAEGISAALADTVVLGPDDGGEWFRLASASLAGGRLNLQDRSIGIGRLALADGVAKAGFDERGELNWSGLLGADASTDAPAADEAPVASGQQATWRVAVDEATLDGFSFAFEDRRTQPAFTTGLTKVRLSASSIDSAASAPMQIDFTAGVVGGGTVGAKGKVRADNGHANLTIMVNALELAPLQPFLSKVAALRLASGAVSAEGRLRSGGDTEQTAELSYQGSLSVERLRLDEEAPPRPFFTWASVASDDVLLTIGPNRLDIGEMLVDGASSRLIIAADQSINLTDVLRKPDDKAAAAEPEAEPAGDSAQPAFPVSVARMKFTNGALDFADLSLRPRFGARMHDLEGVVTGLGNDPESIAQLQLDAIVDTYGEAKIRGQISPLQPEKDTAIDVSFRNLEMTSLSPYVVKFAGYKIAGGKLSLDLQYRVENSKLQGENKVVLNQVELGEKVDSPGALDLPLELALAILKDGNGVIDIALPVSGDLGDPQFDYGAVIGKAVGNLIGGVVTAPFRALGALLGGDAEKLDSVEFEPGSDTLSPPVRQRLKDVARALHERPSLMLKVPPAYDSAEDRPALKSLTVRRELTRLMGIELAAGEDPGPVDVTNPRVQKALEASYLQRHSVDALAKLRDQPPAQGAGQASPSTLYRRMLAQLVEEQPLADQALVELADRRGAAIVRELTTSGGLTEDRVAMVDVEQAADSVKDAVVLRLELDVAR